MDPITSTLFSTILGEALSIVIHESTEKEYEKEIISDAIDQTSQELDFLNEMNARLLFDIEMAEQLVQEQKIDHSTPKWDEWSKVINDDIVDERLAKDKVLHVFVRSFENAAVKHPEYGEVYQLKYNKKIESKVDLLIDKIENSDIDSKSDEQELEKALTNHTDQPIGYYRDYTISFTLEELTSNIQYNPLSTEFDREYYKKLNKAYDRHSEQLAEYAKDIIGSDTRNLRNLPLKDIAIAIGYNAKLQHRDIWEILNSEPVETRANSYLFLGVRTLDELHSV
jgi:hypothetical protein